MTGMLASVNSVAEAKIVLDAGVDIIDIKNPQEGALGALKTQEVKKIVEFVNGEVLTSATIGDVISDDPELLNYIISMSETGVDYVKVGLFDSQPSEYFINMIRVAASKGIKLVIVLFAENYQQVGSVRSLMQTGISGIMLDTKEKKGKSLKTILNNNELEKFVETAKEFDLLTGLAGSLKFDDIAQLLPIKSDYLGFRGALCSESNRIKSINTVQVEKIRNAIPLSDFNKFQNTEYKEAIIG
jgi:(5-formylfuran-3-yl)methyl phosphate synthase